MNEHATYYTNISTECISVNILLCDIFQEINENVKI